MNRKTIITGLILLALLGLGSLFVFDADSDGSSYFAGDCQPFNDAIGNSIPEVSFDGTDQNCDGRDFISEDEDDMDGDGYSVLAGDCNDQKDLIHPSAIEISDDIDNDCDKLTDEKSIVVDLISSPIVPETGSRAGITGMDFLRDIGANTLQVSGSGSIYEGHLIIEGSTVSDISPNTSSKWTAIRLYLGRGTKNSYSPLEERYLDAVWKGNGRNNLKVPDDALEQGGTFYAGQTRKLDFNLRAIPVSAKSYASDAKEELDFIALLNSVARDGLIMGFFTSTPGFGKINSAQLTLEVDESVSVNFARIR